MTNSRELLDRVERQIEHGEAHGMMLAKGNELFADLRALLDFTESLQQRIERREDAIREFAERHEHLAADYASAGGFSDQVRLHHRFAEFARAALKDGE